MPTAVELRDAENKRHAAALTQIDDDEKKRQRKCPHPEKRWKTQSWDCDNDGDIELLCGLCGASLCSCKPCNYDNMIFRIRKKHPKSQRAT